MKKKVLLFSILLLVLILPFALSADDDLEVVDPVDDEETSVERARTCLSTKIDEKGCDSLSSEEKIFALMSAGKCKSQVDGDARSGECWPKSSCSIKTTAQAILALGGNDGAEDWILDQTISSPDLSWYLQIESSEAVSCTITYDGRDYSTTIGTDKKISSSAGSCLSVSTSLGGYWLKVLCDDKEFDISCDQSFQTNLLFKKTTSSTIHVSSETHEAEANGKTTERVNSLCFATGSSCDYEGSLWAALVLAKDHDISIFQPYLVAMVNEVANQKYLPESFLYGLGDESFRSVLEKQKSDKWWLESGNKYYDTAVALLPFADNPLEKTNTIDWLIEDVQDQDGCWNNGNIRDTAFLLYSIWPERVIIDEGEDCADLGKYCLRKSECSDAGGSELPYGGCSGLRVCCDRDELILSCDAQGGTVCGSTTQVCSGGRMETSISDNLAYGEQCCVGGVCEEESTTTSTSECEDRNGDCKSFCGGDEVVKGYSCSYSSDFCCVRESKGGGSSGLIIVLIILIVLTIVGIMFRDKLRPFWMMLKSKFGGKKGPKGPAKGGPGGPFFSPPSSSRMPMRRPPRKMLPPRRPAGRRPPARKPKGDFDNVLKKLKEMGK